GRSCKRANLLAFEVADALDWRRGWDDDVDRHPAADREYRRDREALAPKLGDGGPAREADIDFLAADGREEAVESRICPVFGCDPILFVYPLVNHGARPDLVKGLREIADPYFDLGSSSAACGKHEGGDDTETEQHTRSFCSMVRCSFGRQLAGQDHRQGSSQSPAKLTGQPRCRSHRRKPL